MKITAFGGKQDKSICLNLISSTIHPKSLDVKIVDPYIGSPLGSGHIATFHLDGTMSIWGGLDLACGLQLDMNGRIVINDFIPKHRRFRD